MHGARVVLDDMANMDDLRVGNDDDEMDVPLPLPEETDGWVPEEDEDELPP